VNVTARRAELKSTNGHEASGLHELRAAFSSAMLVNYVQRDMFAQFGLKHCFHFGQLSFSPSCF
jgi:hypothetical protein